MSKINKISGVTLIEMLIGIVISSIIIAAMYTSYSIINNTYSRVTDVAGISKSGRDIVSMIMRDVRMAGFKYLNDDIAANDEHNPIKITSGTGLGGTCDKLEIVYGGVDYDKDKPDGQRYTFTRYKITYECVKSIQAGVDGFKILKSKYICKWFKEIVG